MAEQRCILDVVDSALVQVLDASAGDVESVPIQAARGRGRPKKVCLSFSRRCVVVRYIIVVSFIRIRPQASTHHRRVSPPI